ncbi:MAG: hypothetical protein FWD80_04900 [Propionibacteriaceae bacterium]|nr:hypothetical protein [Propionibacteriaceae bacterium]
MLASPGLKPRHDLLLAWLLCPLDYSGFVHRDTSPHGRTRKLGALAALLAVLLAIGVTSCAKPPVDSSPTTAVSAAPTDSPTTPDPSYDMGTDTPPPDDGTATDAPDSQQTIDHSTSTPPPPSELSVSASMVLDAPYKVLRVVATINNIVSSDGECDITVGSYTTSVPIVPNATNSSCQVNQIPAGAIKRGDDFTVSATSSGLTGTTSGTVQ